MEVTPQHRETKWPSPSRVGALASALMGLAALAALITALALAPSRSGPWCSRDDCVTYPYTDAAEFIVEDYAWMYPAMVMALAFFVWVISVIVKNNNQQHVIGIAAIGVAAMATLVLLLAYSIQIMVMQPSLLKNEVEGLSPWSEYNPQGVFIALENLGYWLAAIALACISPLFTGATPTARLLRWILRVAGLLVIFALPLMGWYYRSDLAYRFEVVAIIVLWPVFIMIGVPAYRWFRDTDSPMKA